MALLLSPSPGLWQLEPLLLPNKKMNNITNRQNEKEMLDLLKARDVLGSRAKWVQGIMVCVTLMLPIAGIYASTSMPVAKPFVVFAALFVSLFDLALVDRWLKSQVKVDARLAEEFDCAVLELDQNPFMTGNPVPPEDIIEAAEKINKEKAAEKPDWYPVNVAPLVQHQARLVCQRSNLHWDKSQRTLYRWILWVVAVCAGVAVGIVSLLVNPNLTDLVLAVTPLTPYVLWMMRENIRHSDTITLVDRLEREADALLNKAVAGMPEKELTLRSRELQDAIYHHRASNPLVFDWVYKYKRQELERQMNHAAKKWVQKFEATAATSAARQ